MGGVGGAILEGRIMTIDCKRKREGKKKNKGCNFRKTQHEGVPFSVPLLTIDLDGHGKSWFRTE